MLASPTRLNEFVARAERVVHARVVEPRSRHEARIQVIESFKGGGETPVPEEEAAYDPLRGYDAELALGVGHVRPAREEDCDDWARRLWLPVFAAPGGELKLWLTPGSVSPESLVETGYETTSFIALQAGKAAKMQAGSRSASADRFPRARAGCIAAISKPLEYEPWEKFFASESVSPIYFRAWSPLSFGLLRRSQAGGPRGARGLGALAQPRARPLGLVLNPRLLKWGLSPFQRPRMARRLARMRSSMARLLPPSPPR